MELQESFVITSRARDMSRPYSGRLASRPLKVFAFDPSLRRSSGNLAVVEFILRMCVPRISSAGVTSRVALPAARP